MKKNIILLLNFVCISVFSQYTFDYKFYVKESSKKSDKLEYDTQIYINSKNADYIIYHYQTDEIRLFDYGIKCTFYFQQKFVNEKKTFEYINKLCYSEFHEERKINHIQIMQLSHNTYMIKTFESEKSKRANLELKIVLEKTDEDLLLLYKLDLGNSIHRKILAALRERLISIEGNSNFIIKELKINYKNGHRTFTRNLSKIEKINMVID